MLIRELFTAYQQFSFIAFEYSDQTPQVDIIICHSFEHR